MHLCLPSAAALFCCIFFCHHLIAAVNGGNPPALYSLGDFAMNCGSLSNSTGLDGREWIAEGQLLEPKGKSTSSTIENRLLSADPIPYMSARISDAQFSYTFQVNPGQKFLRLHFYPSTYSGFEKSQDFFTVKAGPFTLLKNFSASLAADALGVKYLVIEFCLNVEENKRLNLTFSPSDASKLRKTYAFVNGIEIISMPTGLYYTPDGDLGAPVVGQKNRLYHIDNTTALEMVQRLNIGGSSIPPLEDFSMFRRWSEDAPYLLESIFQPVNHLAWGVKDTSMPAFIGRIIAPLEIYQTYWKTGKIVGEDEMHNLTWIIPVDLGFGYLVRLHFRDFGREMTEGGPGEFSILVNNHIAEARADLIRWSTSNGTPIYRDYIVMIKGDKEEGKCDLLISLQSADELAVGYVAGLEIFKLSNPDNSLASPNPAILKAFSTSENLLSSSGQKKAIIRVILTILIILLIFILYKFKQFWEETFQEEKDARSTSSNMSYRCFSLAEIISATQNFSDAFLIGKGGFGKVYKGFICGSSEIVAVKRLKPNSKQGAREFWTEIETLSNLRHINLAPLLGYCNECNEMILVYEYMPRGTLADNLYKISRNGNMCTPLTWEQRLRICIGAARGLDYLHTGTEYGVIHRDVKDSNILLDENLVAKVSDFGLSKLEKLTQSQSYVSTKVKGTFGYLDPDYFLTHKLTRKTDVYAFGVVLLVVLAGRPALDTRIPEEPQSLLVLFKECIAKGKIDDIVDPSLQGQVSLQSLKEFVKSVENCLHQHPKTRPPMSQVVASLESLLEQQQCTMSSLPEKQSS